MVSIGKINREHLRGLSTQFLEAPLARGLARLGISPNLVTLFGLVLSGLAAYLITLDRFILAGAILLLSGVFDLLDGSLARLTGKVSKFGSLLDSLVDRVSEGILFFGFLVLSLDNADVTLAILSYAAFAGSVFVSYARARSEGLGIKGVVGIMTRPERVAVVVIGLFTGLVSFSLAIIVLFSGITTLQRLIFAARTDSSQTQSESSQRSNPKGYKP